MKSFEYYGIEHFLKFAAPVKILPKGWCVYQEAVDFE